MSDSFSHPAPLRHALCLCLPVFRWGLIPKVSDVPVIKQTLVLSKSVLGVQGSALEYTEAFMKYVGSTLGIMHICPNACKKEICICIYTGRSERSRSY